MRRFAIPSKRGVVLRWVPGMRDSPLRRALELAIDRRRLTAQDPERNAWPGLDLEPRPSAARALLEPLSTHALVLGVPSLAATRTALEGRLPRTEGSIAWLDPDQAFGLRLGFAEL